MSKYNRDFLVPYLEDICALYMCEEVLLARAFKVQKEIVTVKAGKSINQPSYPNYEDKWSDANVGGVFLSTALIVGAILLMFLVPWKFVTIFCLGVIGLFGWLLISTIKNIKSISDANSVRELVYDREYAEYIKRKRAVDSQNAFNRQKIPKLQEEFDRYNKDIKKCQEIREKAYDANILPMRYRNKYVAMYLYDFFKYSKADDLDVAINTCVLEQIKDRLEEMIEIQAQSIVNQRIMIANQRVMIDNQHEAIEEQREYAAQMKQRVNMITDSLEEQTSYLSMIESNTQVTAFFSALNYLEC